ncbi:MAG: MFS transporter [Acidobacteriota bacterium]|nr:MFS transporter [Acidobacteriota bacterium]
MSSFRKAVAPVLPGFLLSGFLFSLLGALLPAWDFHINGRNAEAGWLFFSLSAGVIAAGEWRRRFVSQWRTGQVLFAACATASLALLALAALPEPVRFAGQIGGWSLLGLAAGALNRSLFESIRAIYTGNPASTAVRGGLYFGLGCLLSAVLIATAFHLNFVPQILLLLALIPGAFGFFYFRRTLPEPESPPEPPLGTFLQGMSKPGAALFALLLFFQSGNEWTVAGWLPLFLTHRLGISPESALWMLALYWLILLLSRLVNIYLLARVRHSRLLFGSAAAALLGCLLLASTDNMPGATTGIILLGAGFAAIYPLVAEKLGHRFPSFHPGIVNSIFSLALAGGLLSPWLAGLLADRWGLGIVMGLPAIGTFLVVVLLLLLWLESKVTGR